MTEDLVADYADPVRQLLTLGETRAFNPEIWPDHRARFDLGHERVSELIRMARDRELHGNNIDDASAWAQRTPRSFEIELIGEIAAMVRLGLADERTASRRISISDHALFARSVKLVAGTRNPLYRTRFRWP